MSTWVMAVHGRVRVRTVRFSDSLGVKQLCEPLPPPTMARASLTAVALAVGATAALAAPAADEITALKGWAGALPSKQYSGFLDVSAEHHIHYVFVEASVAEPSKAPVVLWMNGGPGASSFGYGYLTELGPFFVTPGTGGRQTVRENPKAWTTVANVLFLDSPSNVGFSYCGTKAKTAPCSWTDTSTAALNFGALQQFFSKFPEYAQNRFYIWGESYAGIYIPMLAEAILNASSTTVGESAGPAVPLPVGIGVGNGCLGDEVGKCSAQGTRIEVEFLVS